MVDDATHRNELDPDEPDLDGDEGDEGTRPIIVSLNPPMERVTWQRILTVGLMLGGAFVVGFVIFAFLTINEEKGPTKGLGGVVLLVAGFVTVALLLYLGTLVLRALDMGAPGEALGMPEGSIRALIAMSLILIFAIIGIQVFTAGSAGTELVSTGLTQAQIDALRADGAIVISQTLQTPIPEPPAAALYNVSTRTVMTQEAHDFGLQLMTTVSTLVVAVAGFYFGSRAVSQATTTVSEQLRLARSYSRRGVIGAKPEPGVETQEAPGETVENELDVQEETDEDVENEPIDPDTQGDAGGQSTGTQETGTDGADDGGDNGDDDADDDGQFDAADDEPEAPTDDKNGEPPAQNPQQPPGQPGL
jgi:hypothetical protein